MCIELEDRIIVLEEKVNRFSTLIRISKIINSTLNLKDLLNIIMDSAKEVLKAEASSLMLIDEDTNELEFEIATGDKGEAVRKIRLKMGVGIAGWVAQNGKSVLVADAQNDPRLYKKADEQSKFVTRSMICVPLKVKDKIIGVAQVLNKITGSFSDDDLELFESLAEMSAISIDNVKQYKEKEEIFLGSVKALAAAIDAKDPYTHGHSERVMLFSLAIVDEMPNFSLKLKEVLKLSAVLHDIGKIGLADNILKKSEKLTDIEFQEVKKHPAQGANIMSSIRSMKEIIPGMIQHHERYDGKGYPERLKGDDISLFAKIISIADSFDAMTSDRPYRKGLPIEVAITEIKKNIGAQFDPNTVSAFIKVWEKGKLQEIMQEGRKNHE